MEVTEDEVNKETLNNVSTAIEMCHFHMNLNLLVFHVDRT